MLKKITSLLLSLCLSAAAVSGLTVTASAAETRSNAWGEYSYEDGYYHISTADQLLALSNEINSGTNDPLLTYKYRLDNDIVIPNNDEYRGKINIAADNGRPFAGEFDGNGHTIYNLKDAEGITGGGNKGLFGFAKGATIKNLIIDGAELDSVYCGGILVSQAENTNIFNIQIRNSNLQIISGGAVITLITSGGATGGAIAGGILNCTLYNCEAYYTNVYVHNSEGITLLGGDNYYIGGLVGQMTSSTLEYSRAIGEGTTRDGSVYVDSRITLPVLGGKTAYVGGLAGMMGNNSVIIDSFCSTYVDNEFYTDIPLLGGGGVHTGGIVSRVDGGRDNLIERCHFSGLIESVATLSSNINLGGIASFVDKEDTDSTRTYVTIKNCFYNWDKAKGKKEDPLIPVIQPVYGYFLGKPVYDDNSRITIDNSDSKNDELYSDIEHQWVPHGYDFSGTILRSSNANDFLGGKHINQWVLDEENNMPVHGRTMAEIYSNITNAFVEKPKSMEYQYSINADNTVTLPNESAVGDIEPGLQNEGFIGFAFVSEREFEGQNVYTCDALYLPGTEVDANVFETYGIDPDKRIYAVWCQAKTLGAQLGLNAGNEGLRVLTAVNTDLLDNIGPDLPDDEYGRGATFVMDNEKYLIKADSHKWRGEAYYDKSTISDIKNPRVFSIFAAMDETDYGKQITYSGDILWFGNNADGTEAVFDFICNSDTYRTSVSDIAERYLSDLEASGASEAENYGLTDEQYGVLKQYID